MVNVLYGNSGFDRRRLLVGTAGAAAGLVAAAAGCSSDMDRRPSSVDSPGPNSLPHQVGVTTGPAASSVLASFDVRVVGREGLADLLRQISDATGRAASEVLISAGASLFDGRYGLAGHKPARLAAMPAFPNDVLDPAWCHGDLLLQVCAGTAATAQATLKAITDTAGPDFAPRWRMPGFRAENTVLPTGRATTRNLLGFREGMSNPDPRDPTQMDRLVWVQPGGSEPAWAAGGSYQVVRLVRFATELWNREPIAVQEAVFGRRKSDGAPLGHDAETEDFSYAADPTGQLVALDAHIRRANPRTPATESSRILRRGYSYRTAGSDQGLIFVCFQQDLARGFETIQHRLAGEALQKYILTFGGGYYYALPGATIAPGDYVGRSLIRAAGG
jgi:deferrochelatase/peroxidase EfeB